MPKAFTDTIRDLRRGALAAELTDALAQLVNAVDNTGKPGTLTLQISVKRASATAGTFVVTDKVTLKAPSADSNDSLLFGTPEGSLITQDPRQQQLDLKTVPSAIERGEVLKTA